MELTDLVKEIKACTICADYLPLGPRPCLTADTKAKVMIVGQAPGTKVHASGIPWDDKSGELLREWLGVTNEEFYNPELFAIVPMGFCYPGKGKSGDLPPRQECAPLWHDKLLDNMPDIKLTILIGQYAQNYYLQNKAGKNLTETVMNYHRYLPHYLPLPHPSPRNRFWLKKNPWFKADVLPVLKQMIANL